MDKDIRAFEGIRVAVLGDVILDEYLHGRVTRLSPEAPVPVVEVRERYQTLGGAGNVARNVSALGGVSRLFSVVGKDAAADSLMALADQERIKDGNILVDPSRPTTFKQRVVAQTQQIVRIDAETVHPIGNEFTEKLASQLLEALDETDVLIISDYDKGVITEELLRSVVGPYTEAGKPVVVDPNVVHFFQYKNVSVITPNHLQLERVSGKRIRTEEELFATGREIRSRLGQTKLLITRGEEGMALVEEERIEKIPTVAQEVYDVTGAGDTVVAVLALGLGAGLTLSHSARLANAAAGIVVGKRGTATLTPNELWERLKELEAEAK